MKSLNSNIVKRIERLPKPRRLSDALQPLFEAISNAIHSTQERYGDQVSDEGRIYIDVQLPKDKAELAITVGDNGMGLNERHFEAFITTDTDNKIAIGGKGVGRLLWLDCFANIKIQSFYLAQDGTNRSRKFTFVLSNKNQITDYEDAAADRQTPEYGMNIRFEGLRSNAYAELFPKRGAYIFQHFVSHFLPVLIGGRCPRVTIICAGDSREYPKDIGDIICRQEHRPDIEVDPYGKLDLTLMECEKVASSDLKGNHFIHFIAHDRTVTSQKIDGKLGFSYFGAENDRVFHACLKGEYLDTHVNQERTSFLFEDSVIDNIVNEVCMPHVQSFLAEPISDVKLKQQEVLEKITGIYPSVSFGTVEELQKHIPLGELQDDAIYGHLSRQRYRRDRKQDEKIKNVLYRMKIGKIDGESFSNSLRDAASAIEDAEQKSLAEYVIRRKIILEFLQILIQKVRIEENDSSFQREDILHSFICPLRVTTLPGGGPAIEPAPSHDLWVIDERLTFAQYFSSDTSFKKLAESFKSDERADLLIFDHVHGLRQDQNPSRVLLVEFKRPGRKDYADDENPQFQVERYVRTLIGGEQMDVNGRPIKLTKETIFYCYIIADCVGKMNDWTFSWSATPDGRGRIFQPRSGFNGMIELITWDKLLDDAAERNKAFFDRAGIASNTLLS